MAANTFPPVCAPKIKPRLQHGEEERIDPMPLNFSQARNWNRTAPVPTAGSYSLSPAVDGGELAPAIPNLLAYVDAPAMSAAELPDGATATYTLLECADAGLTSPSSSTVLGVQTGAGGIGAAAATFASRPQYRGGQYIGLRVDASSGASFAGLSFTLKWALLGPM